MSTSVDQLDSTDEWEDFDFTPSGTIDTLISEFAGNPDTGHTFLKERWIAQTLSSLRECRLEAGLTQSEIAEELKTRQSAIARLERSHDISLSRIWDYMEACGKAPLQLQFAEMDALQSFVVAFPDRPTTLTEIVKFSLRDQVDHQRYLVSNVDSVRSVGTYETGLFLNQGTTHWIHEDWQSPVSGSKRSRDAFSVSPVSNNYDAIRHEQLRAK